jgi:drug/metabolite transporter (DMT)-like permease
MNQRGVGVLAILGVAFAWGTVIPVLTHLSERWDAYFLSASRYILAAPLLYAALFFAEGFARPAARPALWRVLATGWLGLASFAFLFTIGVTHANPVIAAVLAAANPIVAALVARLFFGQPIDRAMMPSIALAFVGCALATINWRQGELELTIRGGEALMLFAAGCWTWYSLAVHRWLKGWSQLRIAAHTVASAAPMLFVVYALLAATGIASFPPEPAEGWDLALFVWMVLVAVVAGLLLWNFGVSRVGIMVAALFVNLSPIIAVSLLALLGTPPNLLQILGGLLVIGGVIWCEIRPMLARRKSEKMPPKTNE